MASNASTLKRKMSLNNNPGNNKKITRATLKNIYEHTKRIRKGKPQGKGQYLSSSHMIQQTVIPLDQLKIGNVYNIQVLSENVNARLDEIVYDKDKVSCYVFSKVDNGNFLKEYRKLRYVDPGSEDDEEEAYGEWGEYYDKSEVRTSDKACVRPRHLTVRGLIYRKGVSIGKALSIYRNGTVLRNSNVGNLINSFLPKQNVINHTLKKKRRVIDKLPYDYLPKGAILYTKDGKRLGEVQGNYETNIMNRRKVDVLNCKKISTIRLERGMRYEPKNTSTWKNSCSIS